MEASDQAPAPDPAERVDAPDQEPVVGDQGEPAPIEQSDAQVGAQPDGSFRQSAPDPARQSGVPIEEDRAAGVEPGEARTPEFADEHQPVQSPEAGVGAPSEEEHQGS